MTLSNKKIILNRQCSKIPKWMLGEVCELETHSPLFLFFSLNARTLKTRVLYISVVQRATTITTVISLLRQASFDVFHVITSIWNVLWFYVSYFYDL